MKNFVTLILVSAFAIAVIPAAFLKDTVKTSETAVTAESMQSPSVTAQADDENVLTVFRSSTKETKKIDFFEYVCGSVAAEMPLSYHEEALKAQAVACYTNALRLKSQNNNGNNSDITDDSSVHQGYINKTERKNKWGDDFDKYENKLENAVKSVENEAIYYNEKLCVAAFFAICGGTTESAENVWGEKVPYLTSVKSNGDTLSPQYSTSVSFDKKEFLQLAKSLGANTENVNSLKDFVKITKTTKAGTVTAATIGNKKVSGDDLRKTFSLRSAVFTVKCDKKTVVFEVRGYGHGVGMSQYGADFMARQGSTYDEILKHYYTGVTIK